MEKILIVDDDPDMVDIIHLMLKREGFNTKVAYSGNECIEILKSEIFDLILLDIMMKPMDGWETLDYIKNNPETKEIPVSMLTVVPLTLETMRKRDTERIENYIVKPFSKKELIEKVREILGTEVEIKKLSKVLQKKVGKNFAEEFQKLKRRMNRHDRLIEVLDKCNKQDKQRKRIKISNKEKEELIGLCRISLSDLTNKIIKEMKILADEKNQEINTEIDEDITIIGVEGMITRIIKNLLSNAFKFTNENGNILIKAKVEDNNVHVMVCDNGIGMSKKEQGKIFNRFYIIENQLQHKDKRGLSLAIVKEIIEAHNGKIWVESEKGKGSTFHFTLPKEVGGEIYEKITSCT